MVDVPGAEVLIESSPQDGHVVQRVRARAHTFLVDEPMDPGADVAPSPYDLLLAALGACTSMTLTLFAEINAMPLESVSVRLTYNRDYTQDCADCEQPGKRRRVHRIEREITLTGDLSDADRQKLLTIAERCPVHRTLEEEKEIVTRLV